VSISSCEDYGNGVSSGNCPRKQRQQSRAWKLGVVLRDSVAEFGRREEVPGEVL
jgi:hypothetical protein